MNRRALLLVAAMLTVTCGCSSYQLSGASNRSSVELVSPDTFAVNFCGNAYMSREDVDKFALQRASEMALSKGYAYFSVVDKQDDSEFCALDPKFSSSYDYPPFLKPNVTFTIKCFAKGDSIPGDAINAEEFLKENFPGMGR